MENLNDIKRKILYTLSQQKCVPFEDLVLRVDPSLLFNSTSKVGHFIATEDPEQIQSMERKLKSLEISEESSMYVPISRPNSSLDPDSVESEVSGARTSTSPSPSLREPIFQPPKRKHTVSDGGCTKRSRQDPESVEDDHSTIIVQQNQAVKVYKAMELQAWKDNKATKLSKLAET